MSDKRRPLDTTQPVVVHIEPPKKRRWSLFGSKQEKDDSTTAEVPPEDDTPFTYSHTDSEDLLQEPDTEIQTQQPELEEIVSQEPPAAIAAELEEVEPEEYDPPEQIVSEPEPTITSPPEPVLPPAEDYVYVEKVIRQPIKTVLMDQSDNAITEAVRAKHANRGLSAFSSESTADDSGLSYVEQRSLFSKIRGLFSSGLSGILVGLLIGFFIFSQDGQSILTDLTGLVSPTAEVAGIDENSAPGVQLTPTTTAQSILVKAQVNDNKIMANLTMNEESGDLRDVSGRGANGLPEGDVVYAESGVMGGSIELKGNGAFVIPKNEQITSAGPYTDRSINLWFKADSVQARQVIYEEGNSEIGLNMYIDSGSVYFGNWNSSKDWSGSWIAAPIEPNSWYNLSWELKEGKGKVQADKMTAYLNGEKLSSKSAPRLENHQGDITIGAARATRFHDGTTNDKLAYQLSGNIDELSIFNRALTTTEIIEIFAVGRIEVGI